MKHSAASGAVFSDEVLAKLNKAASIIKKGGVITCPTEGVYGLSCLASNDEAIKRILDIKHRALNKGLIVVASNANEVGVGKDAKKGAYPCASWADLSRINDNTLDKLLELWPGHVTAIIPVNDCVSKVLTGNRDSLALRITPYPLLAKLCELIGEPIVSTSANISGSEPLSTIAQIEETFSSKVDYILDEPCQGLNKPSKIIDALSGKVIRE